MIGWRRRLRSLKSHWHWVLADQVVVSGCNFVIAIVYARALGPTAFGTYALITVAQQYFVSVSVSLIGNPLVTAVPHLDDGEQRRQLIASSFAAQLLVSGGMALLAATGLSIYLAMDANGATGISRLAVIGLAASSFALPLLEWCRRLCFLSRDGAALLRFDALTYPPVAVTAFVLAQSGRLTLDLAVSLWGVSSAAAALYAASRQPMPGGLAGAASFMARHWRLARDFTVSFQAQWLGSQGMIFLAAPVLGSAGIGAYRSISGLLGFTNALGSALDNLLPIRFAEVYAAGGQSALDASARRYSLRILGPLLLLIAPLFHFSAEIVAAILGSAYARHSHVLWLQGVVVLLLFAVRIATFHQRACLNTRAVAISASVGAAAAVIAVIPLTSGLGVVGLVSSVIVGELAALLYIFLEMARQRGKA